MLLRHLIILCEYGDGLRGARAPEAALHRSVHADERSVGNVRAESHGHRAPGGRTARKRHPRSTGRCEHRANVQQEQERGTSYTPCSAPSPRPTRCSTCTIGPETSTTPTAPTPSSSAVCAPCARLCPPASTARSNQGIVERLHSPASPGAPSAIRRTKAMVERIDGGPWRASSDFETRWKPKSWNTRYRFIFIRKRVRRQNKAPVIMTAIPRLKVS